jgi:Putative MetA-pathway of phenol degradation
MRLVRLIGIYAGAWMSLGATFAAADECTQPSSPIETDRPDTTNSAIVVPFGSFQDENGINIARQGGAEIFDGTNSRWRLGVAPCFEVLVDLPDYFTAFDGGAASGFGDATPAVKWQVSPAAGKFDVSIVAGAGLPTGARAIAGPGVQPYLQFPWSVDLGRGWSLNGMETNFFTPSNALVKFTNQSTLVIEKEVNERSFLFAEYVGDYPTSGGSSQLFNSGGGYRLTDTQQIDFHVGFGLNRNAPAYIFGLGYSSRFDRLF